MVYKKAYKIILFTFAILCFCLNTNAQYASEDELKKAADNYFVEQDYVKALPLFSQLLSLYPKDVNYNYKYGTSFFFAKREKDDALKFLKFATTKATVDPKAYYYLGLVYHHNYQFSAAEVNYKKFKEKGSAKDFADLDVDRNIEMCKNGLRLLKSMTDIGVLYKKEIKATDFFRSYDLKGIGGKIIVKPDEFKTKLDLKKNETSLIHLGDQPKMVIFSSYGNDGKTGKDIYRVVRLPNGEWSKPAAIGDGINTNYDEDYPFLHPDGRTLYFSSKGYNSMGGYDIFKSVLNPETGQWSFPENLDFPINTPDDDILFISDIDNELAFFASSRASMQGELTVYKVQVDAQPSENSIVKGIFLAESNPSLKSATIKIMDAEKERTYGVYSTDDNGDYLLVFPSNGGKYKILVETTDNAPIHSAIIELPVIEGFRALKQELRLVGEGDNEKLVVKNLFDESDEFDITDPLIVENLLKIKAKMDVNITEEELLAKVNDKNIASASDYADLSDEELKSTSEKQANKIIAKAKTSRNQANYSYQLANVKSAKAKELFTQSRNLEKEAANETDNTLKQQKLIEAKHAKNKAAGFVNETIAALNLAKALESEAVERESDVENVKALKADISTLVVSGNRNGAEEKYAELEKIAEAAYQNQSVLNTEKELAENKFTEKEIAYNKARNEVIELANREIELNGNIESTESKIATTTKKNDKTDLENQLSALKIDLEDVKYDLGVAKTAESKLKTEFTAIKNNTATAEKVIETVTASNANNNVGTVDKLALSNDVAYFEKEGLVGLYPDEESLVAVNNATELEIANNETNYNVAEHADEYSIVNEEGVIKDYNTEYSSALVDAENETNERQKSLQLAKVNQDWVNAIDEEIEISKKQAETSQDLNEKVKLKSKIEKLNNLKEEKQKQAEVQLLIAETLNESSNETEIAETNTDEVNVINEEGNVTDYEEGFNNELVALENEPVNNQTNAKKVAVYKNWSNAIEQEVLLEKIALENAEGDEKIAIENKVEKLETQLKTNEDLIAKLESENESSTVAANIDNNTTTTNTTTTNTVDPTKYSNEVVAENGEVLDYSSTFENELTTAENKEEVTQNWINAIDEEISYREEQISATNDEDEKAVFAARVNELNALKNEQQEALADFQLTANNIENTEEETNITSTNTTQPVINNTKNPTVYNSSAKDESLNVNYNSDYNYNSTQSKKELASVNQLKDEAINLYTQADEKTISLVSIDDITERETVIKEINQLKEQAQVKEVSVAKVYAKSNKSEFYNNQEVLSKVRANSDKNSNNSTIAEMLVDESNTYFEQAIDERAKADNASSFTTKELALQKAYNLELQALAKQTNAIALYGDNQNIEDVYADVNKAPSSKSIENTNNTNSVNNSVNKSNTNINTTNNSENVAESSNSENQFNPTPIYQPLAISLPSNQERIKGDLLNREADELEANAKVLNDSAAVVTKKKEKDDLTNQANALTEEAQRKRTEADVFYANATKMEATEVELVDELNENRSKLSNEQMTKEDESAIASLSASELETITGSPAYKNYAEAKQSSRRLIKEAEVDYIQADKFEQEAEDEKTLGISLNALAAGAQGDAKIKLQGQLKKLEAMIAENKAKANEARANATEKEKKALRLTKEAEVILVSNNQQANKLRAIEKAKAYDDNLLANVGTNARITNEVDTEEVASNEVEEVVANNTTETVENNEVANEVEAEEVPTNEVEEVVANNTTETVGNNEVVNEVDTEEVASNEVEEVVANNTTETVDNTEVANEVDTEEVAINEVEEVVANNTNETFENNETTNEIETEEVATNEVETSTNNVTPTNVNINEIPKVLTAPIFVFNGNNKSEYSSSNPIPGVEKLPEGLVFKVQIGAFRNPIPQDHFRGFAPIMVEDAGNGIKRYTAGFFKTINMAVEAKNSIKSIGYEDAFVVAFYNGKRISINEARAKLGEVVDENPTIVATNNTQNTTENRNNTTTTNNSSTIENNSTTSNKAPVVATNYEEVNDGVSTDVHKIEGTFFTIQVGVYSKPVTADQLSNVTPLNSEKTANGLIRYTSGVYKNMNDANTAKDRVRGLGITDAFVIAYANGNRVTVSEAIEYLKTPENNSSSTINDVENNNSNSPKSSIVNESENNTTNNPVENNNSLEENTTTTTSSVNEFANNEMETPANTNLESTANNSTSNTPKEPIDQVKIGQELNIVFKVLLGEYEDDIPVDEAAVYLKLSGQGMEIKEEDGKSRYTIGAYPDYPSALDKQLEMKEEGIRKPKIIAFKDGTKIEVEEALELVKNNN